MEFALVENSTAAFLRWFHQRETKPQIFADSEWIYLREFFRQNHIKDHDLLPYLP